MNTIVKSSLVVLLTALSVIGCSGDTVIKDDPYNQDDSQRSRAKQAQDELSRDTAK